MTEDDERRRSSGVAVVLFDELISLKLPYSVRVVLHFLERKAVEESKGTQRINNHQLVKNPKYEMVVVRRAHLKIAMSRLSSSMLAKSR